MLHHFLWPLRFLVRNPPSFKLVFPYRCHVVFIWLLSRVFLFVFSFWKFNYASWRGSHLGFAQLFEIACLCLSPDFGHFQPLLSFWGLAMPVLGPWSWSRAPAMPFGFCFPLHAPSVLQIGDAPFICPHGH